MQRFLDWISSYFDQSPALMTVILAKGMCLRMAQSPSNLPVNFVISFASKSPTTANSPLDAPKKSE